MKLNRFSNKTFCIMIKKTLRLAALALCLCTCSPDSMEQTGRNNTIDNLARKAIPDPANPKNPTVSQQALVTNADIQIVLQDTALSPHAKTSLESFINQLFSQDYPLQNYELIYTTIVNYEAGVRSVSDMTDYDKKVILTTTSIARYASARDKRKGKDKDWKLSRNNIIAAAGGAVESEAKSVVVSLANGIYRSKLN